MSHVRIRKMMEDDQDFILDLSARFNEFEFMEWRDLRKMEESQLKIAKEAIASIGPDSEIFVAEDWEKNLLGYLHMTKNIDYFTGIEQGYISSIAVSKDGEGKGIAKKLMEKAEEWSKKKGYHQLTLNVFANNERAHTFYSKLNFENEIIKMVKEID
ncbi:GNAT family N-acetyltransferase [Mesobacillus boroniphilus]|uniref:GNAT family N-acetyltransferase n=1 Tax=Mesobacillus boroniphilus TaxID=308892 RepID=A0A944GX44_9BACI|nr:GNAT family N-acetyltransferase [Mesobacillus boroniphilus]MBS8265402.1 GNAT family N-acetyltransferase [Mesobacillus boroniphilus]